MVDETLDLENDGMNEDLMVEDDPIDLYEDEDAIGELDFENSAIRNLKDVFVEDDEEEEEAVEEEDY